MSDSAPMKEIYVGCECMDLDHVAHFAHFPLTEKEIKENKERKFPLPEEDDENIIYLSVSVHNFFRAIIPPIIDIFDGWAWQSYFQHNWFKRLWIAGRYIADPSYQREYGILDAFDFQNKNLDKIDAFLSLISSAIDDNSFSISEGVRLDDNGWLLKIEPTRLEFKKCDFIGSWQVGWEVQFKNRGFFGRMHYAFKYIFGQHSPEKGFTIYEKDAAKIRGMIKWVQDTNKKDDKNDR
jgi:hypothetical protein